MRRDKENYVDEWRRLKALVLSIQEYAKADFPKDSRLRREHERRLFALITPDLIRRSGAVYDPSRIQQPDLRKLRDQLYADAKDLKKKLAQEASTQIPIDEYRLQRNVIQKLTFIDAIMPVPDFAKWVVLLRLEFDIDPKKLKKRLGLSDEEIKMITSAVNPAHRDALIRELYGTAEMHKRRRLAAKKEAFERDFFRKYFLKQPKPGYLRLTRGLRPLRIPKVQEPHMRNYILYGVKTGTLISTVSGNGGRSREWQNRLLSTGKSKHNYVPFMRSWLYYFTRISQKRSPREARQELTEMGFPAVRRESDDTLIKRYEGLFLR